MPYATRADLEDLFGSDEIFQRESVLPPGALDRFLSNAEAEIDSYVGSRYAVPISPVPENLRKAACVIARYNLLGEAVSERARKDYEDARAWLRDIQAGRANIASAASVPGASPAEAVVIGGRERVFNGGLL